MHLFFDFLTDTLQDFLAKKRSLIHRAGWERRLTSQRPLNSVERQAGDRVMLQFCSNDYLGLSQDARILQAGWQAVQAYGAGATGSRLITGTTDLHLKLEEDLAWLTGRESALFFSSGYSANLGAISSLVGVGDIIYGDAYNHASILSGARLSGARQIDYAHLDYADLRSKLSATRSQYQNALLVSDSLFSMDGDCADLQTLIQLSQEFDLWLMVDEAHSLGVYGERGSGLCQGLPIPILIGTCSKALGVEGGFVAGSKELIDFMVQRASSFKYSTAPSPFTVGALIESLAIVTSEEGDLRRQQLHSNIQKIRSICTEAGLALLVGDSPILIIPAASIGQALEWSEKLLVDGIWIQAIRPPTAPTARLRVTISSILEEVHMSRLTLALRSIHQ